MNPRKIAATMALLLLHPFGWADASFQSSTQMNGGALVNMVKSTPFAPPSLKTMLEPDVTITAVHGNQKAVTSRDSTEIDDIDKQTVTRVDHTKKTYTVMTFEQMRQMMKNMPQRLAEMEARMQQMRGQNNAAAQYTITSDTKVNDPGVSKVVNGLKAQERIITVTTKVTNATAPQNTSPIAITYVTTTDLWFAPEPPEMQEIQNFDTRMYAKISDGIDMKAIAAQMKAIAGSAGMGMMLSKNPGASNAMEEMNKEIEKIKGIRVLEITSMSGTGLPNVPAADPSSLMGTTKQMTNFSLDPVPASAFQIPAGYKQVDLPKGMF